VKRSTLYTIAVVAAVAALFFYLTTARATQTCRVCVQFRGRTNCATARAGTVKDAVTGAQQTACGPLAAGMDQRIACDNTPPVSTECQSA
jgi:hypothetical protein